MATKSSPGPFADRPYDWFVGRLVLVEHGDTGLRQQLRISHVIRGMDDNGAHLPCADVMVGLDEAAYARWCAKRDAVPRQPDGRPISGPDPVPDEQYSWQIDPYEILEVECGPP